MGHAGALIGAGENSARSKVKALEDAGVVITNHPSKFGDGMKRLLGGHVDQKRCMHTLRRPVFLSQRDTHTSQQRHIYIQETRSNKMLQDLGVPIAEDEDPRGRDYFLTITYDRSNYSPCIITSYSIGGESAQNHAKSHSLGLDKRVDAAVFSCIAAELKCRRESFDSLTKILSSMMQIFFDKDGFELSARLSRNIQGVLAVARSSFKFDDAALRSGKRQDDIQKMRDMGNEINEEVEAEKDGIVYIKLVLSEQ